MATSGSAQTRPRRHDLFDLAGGLMLPVERIRHFVTPIDLAGDGELITYGTSNNRGCDRWGRVHYFKYFRPPGLPTLPPPTPDPASIPSPPMVAYDLTNNRYHGFESLRNPLPAMPFNGTTPRP